MRYHVLVGSSYSINFLSILTHIWRNFDGKLSLPPSSQLLSLAISAFTKPFKFPRHLFPLCLLWHIPPNSLFNQFSPNCSPHHSPQNNQLLHDILPTSITSSVSNYQTLIPSSGVIPDLLHAHCVTPATIPNCLFSQHNITTLLIPL